MYLRWYFTACCLTRRDHCFSSVFSKGQLMDVDVVRSSSRCDTMKLWDWTVVFGAHDWALVKQPIGEQPDWKETQDDWGWGGGRRRGWGWGAEGRLVFISSSGLTVIGKSIEDHNHLSYICKWFWGSIRCYKTTGLQKPGAGFLIYNRTPGLDALEGMQDLQGEEPVWLQ